MNTNLTIRTEEQLTQVKYAELASIYNEFATQLGLKSIKKFQNKSVGISRILQIQEDYVEEYETQLAKQAEETQVEEFTLEQAEPTEPVVEPVVEPVKRQTRFDMSTIVSTVYDNSKEGTIENSLHAAIFSGCDTAGEIVNWVIENHKRPRSGLGVDEQYVIHNLKWFSKKGTLKLCINIG